MNFNFQNLIRSANASLIVYAKLCGRIRDANDFIFRIQIYSWNQFGMQEMKKKNRRQAFRDSRQIQILYNRIRFRFRWDVDRFIFIFCARVAISTEQIRISHLDWCLFYQS